MAAELLSNLREIVHIKIEDKKQSKRYGYIPPKPATWYRKAKPESLYNHMYDEVEVPLPNNNWLEENYYILDDQNRIWSKPRVYIWFSDGAKPLEYIFNTYEECKQYRDNVLAQSLAAGLVLKDLEKCR